MRESFVFYRSFYESIRLLPKKYQLQCFDALCNYALNDVPLEGVSGTVEAILKSFKPQVDANNRRYENGCKGGRPKGDQDKTKAKRNDNDNDNVNVNVNDNDNDNALASSSGGRYQCDDEFNIWKKLTPEDIDVLYEKFPESGGLLIDAVYEDVKTKKTKVKSGLKYILGYAKNVGWDDKKMADVKMPWEAM